jgi:hypothetical protein
LTNLADFHNPYILSPIEKCENIFHNDAVAEREKDLEIEVEVEGKGTYVGNRGREEAAPTC